MTNVWDRAAGVATCRILENFGDALTTAGAYTLATGVGVKPGLVKIGLGSLSYLAAGALCSESEAGPSDPYPAVEGCQSVSPGGYGTLQWKEDSFKDWVDFSQQTNFTDVTEIIKTETIGPGQDGRWIAYVEWKRLGGGSSSTTDARYDTFNAAARAKWRIRVTHGECANTGDGPTPLPDGSQEPFDWVDEVTNCLYEIALEGFVRNTEDDNAVPVFRMQSKETQQRDNGGGRIGACNFSPQLILGGPGGPGQPPVQPIPVPPDPPGPNADGEPWWVSALRGAIQGATAAVVNKALGEYFATKYPEGTREIYAACDYKENGDPETFSITFPEEPYQERVLTALNAIVDFQQQILLWKTPTCSTSNKPDLFLHWRSITFESDDYTETGNRRLTKRLRYRGSSPGDVVQLAEHWRDFEWDTGGVIVYHKGSPVGTPQVWAASIDEGQRVLRHAFGEAGIDPDQVGEWGTSSSDNPRYGVSRRVKLKVVDGCWMATARQGPSGWPEAAVCPPSP